MKKLLNYVKVFLLGERVKGDPIDLSMEFRPPVSTSYPKELVKPSFNDWSSELNVSARVPKYSSTGSLIL